MLPHLQHLRARKPVGLLPLRLHEGRARARLQRRAASTTSGSASATIFSTLAMVSCDTPAIFASSSRVSLELPADFCGMFFLRSFLAPCRFFASAATASFSRSASSALCIAVRFRRANWLRMIHVLDAERPLAPAGGIWYHVPVFGQQDVKTLPKIESRNPNTRFARPFGSMRPRIVFTPNGAGFIMLKWK